MVTETLTLQQEQELEFDKVCRSFIYFLSKYGRVVAPATKDSKGGAALFEFWPHLMEASRYFDGVKYNLDGKRVFEDDSLYEFKHLIALKSRQVGWSWLVANYIIWLMTTKPYTTVLLYSKGEDEAWELLGKVKRVWRTLPDFMKLTLESDSKANMAFKENGSVCKAYPSTESAGVGEAGSLVVTDEWDFHQYADANFLNAKPTIDSSGGQWIGMFTVDAWNPTTFAKGLFKQSYYDKKSQFKALFHGYTCRPGRDEEWYEHTKITTPERELKGLSPEVYMRINYPRSAEEALAPIQAQAVFDLNMVDNLMDGARPKLNLREKYPEINHLVCNIYKDYQPGKTYAAVSDVGHGIGKDYSVTLIGDVVSHEIVADIVINNIGVELFTNYSIGLLGIYHNPKWFPEDNDQGKWLIATATSLGYKNIGETTSEDKSIKNANKKKFLGYHTGKANRDRVWTKAQSAVNNGSVICHNPIGISQFRDIQYWTGKDGNNTPRIQAAPGRHDDYPIAIGIFEDIVELVPVGKQAKWEPIRTLEYDNDDDGGKWW